MIWSFLFIESERSGMSCTPSPSDAKNNLSILCSCQCIEERLFAFAVFSTRCLLASKIPRRVCRIWSPWLSRMGRMRLGSLQYLALYQAVPHTKLHPGRIYPLKLWNFIDRLWNSDRIPALRAEYNQNCWAFQSAALAHDHKWSWTEAWTWYWNWLDECMGTIDYCRYKCPKAWLV
jgi:hypothetical protein